MFIRIAEVLDAAGLEAVRAAFDDPALFEDGRRTAPAGTRARSSATCRRPAAAT
jgi:hypothetical protein